MARENYYLFDTYTNKQSQFIVTKNPLRKIDYLFIESFIISGSRFAIEEHKLQHTGYLCAW